ncbi:hypothetical protein BBR47_47830 [Brevibacillus brevis NBRC 100599]|uniref:Uncharacterized protein n=1 Tax=Brevibacillus brevis (strain 47 / JCM 6285 / NBRC 100599) TaxID=358681 RepID=C0ZKT3_BREBN|nr:hypothetical protein [Brevibacillus brevis]BAH45760.1 hypothetical protein BBR47_47830 [Brevibacillus brevis NBRC 100599]
MDGKTILGGVLICTLCFTGILAPTTTQNIAEAESDYMITYELPPNPEKYLFSKRQEISIANPQPIPFGLRPYSSTDYINDMHVNIDEFQTSKKGFLWNVYHFIGILPPAYPTDVNMEDLDRKIDNVGDFSDERVKLRKARAQIEMNARLQPLVQAGYVMPNEIDDGIATKEFVATVLYRMFGKTRPYHGGIDLKDSENVSVRWAVEVGVPGFVVNKEKYIDPQTLLTMNLDPQTILSMSPGPEPYVDSSTYGDLFYFITLIMPGKKTDSGWEYYQVELNESMLSDYAAQFIQLNGDPYLSYRNYALHGTAEYKNAARSIRDWMIPRFPQILDQARKDAMKPRVWDWSRDLIHHPKFAKQVAAYRKNKSSKNVDAVYHAVREHYNLTIRQDSPAIIKSVLDNVK